MSPLKFEKQEGNSWREIVTLTSEDNWGTDRKPRKISDLEEKLGIFIETYINIGNSACVRLHNRGNYPIVEEINGVERLCEGYLSLGFSDHNSKVELNFGPTDQKIRLTFLHQKLPQSRRLYKKIKS